MDRRESLKTMVLGSLAVGVSLESCVTNTDPAVIEDKIWKYTYGRTPKEAAIDEKLLADQFFENGEKATIKPWPILYYLLMRMAQLKMQAW